jgi:hypothetical protein
MTVRDIFKERVGNGIYIYTGMKISMDKVILKYLMNAI